MKKKERIRILEQEVERLKIQYATLLAEVNRIRWPDKPALYVTWSQANSDTIADEARSDA